MGFDLASLNSQLGSASSSIEAQLQSTTAGLQGKDISQTDMLNLQFQMNKWQLVTSLQSNMVKTISDGIKSTIQNLR